MAQRSSAAQTKKSGEAASARKLSLPKQIKKRDGSLVAFESSKITKAVLKAMKAAEEENISEAAAQKITDAVLKDIFYFYSLDKKYVPNIEEVQDLVERQLILNKYAKTAKAYILYRDKHSEVRKVRGDVPKHVKELAAESKKHFTSQLSEFVYYTTYSKWMEEEGRRETWVETIQRYNDFMRENLGNKLTDEEYQEVFDYMLDMKALGSMRLLWSSGKAARKANIAAYNCSFIAPMSWQDFAEIMYISMCGTGVGFSVERQNVERLPMIQKQTGKKLKTHKVGDSKDGWADALVKGMTAWEKGSDIDFDYSEIRPAGARLNTMGGRASGPQPLIDLLNFTREKMLARQNRRLSTIDVHDIVCKIGEVVVAGGVRRSALISLSDLDDVEMKEAKFGQFYNTQPQRAMANNSAVYNEKPTMQEFLDEWQNLVKSQSGERGIFNRGALKSQLPVRRWEKFKDGKDFSGTNPCGEIVLQSKQFCNLSEVIARAEDTEETLMEKVRVAAIVGTYQASLTDFPYLSKEWKENCESEALLGISITGQWDCPAVRNPNTLRKLKEVAIETNRIYAERIGINPSTCITCVKPSGNVSQLTNTSSGMHPRHSKYYIRRVRIEAHNPIFHMLKDMGVKYHPEVGQTEETATTFVVDFPVKAPDNATTFKDDLTAEQQLEHWKMLKENYTEHNPSTTISVGEDEWLKVGNWVYDNWDSVGGLSFLPREDHVYKLAPYEEITEEQYNKLAEEMPEIDFSKIVLYEYEDETKGAKELACVSGSCEVDFNVTDAHKATSKRKTKAKAKKSKAKTKA